MGCLPRRRGGRPAYPRLRGRGPARRPAPPPAWISVGDIDLFADECRAYAERLRGAGVDCALHLVPGAPHGFEAWAPDTRVARGLTERARAWLDVRMTGTTSPVTGEACG
ncbi:alpha/beta hydrolase [Streptomyces prunicolor]|uniref:alpha/beta hydrolase n=1 Tax=Streptomyces prunicolor TaxID=67348 RepID=UPI0037D95B94